MITVLPEKDFQKVKEIFAENELSCNEFSGCVTAKSGEEVLGYCLYNLDKNQITILKLEPTEDLLMADGVLRSALHVAAESFVLDARYTADMDNIIFKKLDFIKDETQRKLDIDKLFGGCSCKK